MPTLQTGSYLSLVDGRRIRVAGFIDEGGQGEVYRVEMDGEEYALKWYSKIMPSKEFYDNLLHNIRMGAPADYFLWPLALTEKSNGRFGYIMKLRPSCYRKYSDFLTGEARFASWDTLFVAALNITDGFMKLHSLGYSYQDLNEGSFFIDPQNGDLLICDNDNVAPFGVNLGVKGMPKYMAPEVVTDRSRPNTHSDRYSLAVILFRLFYIDHPLEGRYTVQFPLTDANGARLFGEEPLFVYDPDDKRNRPLPGAHENVIRRWQMFPPDLTAAFTKAFTDGLKNIDGRITELQWLEVLIKARGMLVRLDGREQFVNCYQPETIPDGCRLLRTGEQIIALAPETILYTCQTNCTSTDYRTPSGCVRASVSDPTVYGLGNLSYDTWVVTLPGKEPVRVPPKKFAPLIPGTVIAFGNVTGKVF